MEKQRKVNPGQNVFGYRRPRETNPRSKCVWVQKAKGNESYIYVGAMRLSKTSPIKCWRSQARLSEMSPNNFGETG